LKSNFVGQVQMIARLEGIMHPLIRPVMGLWVGDDVLVQLGPILSTVELQRCMSRRRLKPRMARAISRSLVTATDP
jgi:hypothetical protein